MENKYEPEIMDRVVSISRVAKTVKGGRNMRFRALVVVGDGPVVVADYGVAVSNCTLDPKDGVV